MQLSGSTGSKAKMLGAGAVGAGAIAGTNEAYKRLAANYLKVKSLKKCQRKMEQSKSKRI
jgi:hypothetical protein